jgi:hydroxylamine reductase (hybrid-cluster protein)
VTGGILNVEKDPVKAVEGIAAHIEAHIEVNIPLDN